MNLTNYLIKINNLIKIIIIKKIKYNITEIIKNINIKKNIIILIFQNLIYFYYYLYIKIICF